MSRVTMACVTLVCAALGAAAHTNFADAPQHEPLSVLEWISGPVPLTPGYVIHVYGDKRPYHIDYEDEDGKTHFRVEVMCDRKPPINKRVEAERRRKEDGTYWILARCSAPAPRLVP